MGAKRSHNPLFWAIFIFVVIAAGVYILYPFWKDIRVKQGELQKQEAELHDLKKRQMRLQQQNHDLQTSPAAVEKVAREELRMVRKDESVVYLPKDAETKWKEKRDAERK